MCEPFGAVDWMSRRGLFKGAAVAAGATAGAAVTGAAPAAAVARPVIRGGNDAEGYRTRLVLLGTAGGPTWWTGSDRHRAGISSAVVVGDAVYLVDCGEGMGRRYEQAGLFSQSPASDFTELRAVFLTHLHSDHIAGYPPLMLYGLPGGGLGTPDRPVQVFGPGRRGALPGVFPPGRPVPPVSPGNPWPGTVDMTDLILQAFATDLNDRIRDTAAPDIYARLVAHDIALPPGAGADPNTISAPRLDRPIEVYEDDLVKVTATLVDHRPVFPAFAFRFDTDDGSITFSGDTTVCDNLPALAEGSDILVHEVVDPQWVDASLDRMPLTPDERAAYRQHLIGAHTTIEQVGPVAESAGAKMLLLSHYGPGDHPPERWHGAQQGYSGNFRLGEDLMQIGVGTRPR
ncbi:MBL fold metallo-hydrolase [Nocardia jinanensis]|uniref:Metallo-beta-lactamase domain-containing protein n=1 Tax=Nocardia jinanensis TaxID=382504 RepID=A0A917RWZ4_9NOCA|nr:MBL fold metallo-hydrolase [Nocardia jinanensis]GGL41937.1 hypothetical protein GCM10011588_65870 [Nocardia jinanensis]